MCIETAEENVKTNGVQMSTSLNVTDMALLQHCITASIFTEAVGKTPYLEAW